MEIKFEELLVKPEILDMTISQCNLKIQYEQFKDSIEFFIKYWGNEAKCIFSEKSAYIVFKKYSNVLIIVHKNDGYNIEELYFENLNMEITGTSKRKLPNFFKRLYNDILDNKFIICFFIFLMVLIYKVINNSNESLRNLNDALINVISIFIGTLFVFITLFYEDENKIDLMIENGKFEINSENDKYVFNISLISLVCILVSNSMIEIQHTYNVLDKLKEYIKLNFNWLYCCIRNNISFLLTTIGIILLVICFSSITQYYLKKIKSNAINKKIISFKKEYDKELNTK